MIKTCQSGDFFCSTQAPLGTSAGCSPRISRTTPQASCHFLCFESFFLYMTHFFSSYKYVSLLLSGIPLVKNSHFLFGLRIQMNFHSCFFLFRCNSLVHNTHFFFFLFTTACSAPISGTLFAPVSQITL